MNGSSLTMLISKALQPDKKPFLREERFVFLLPPFALIVQG